METVVETWANGAGTGEIGRSPMLTLQRLYHHAICGSGVEPTNHRGRGRRCFSLGRTHTALPVEGKWRVALEHTGVVVKDD